MNELINDANIKLEKILNNIRSQIIDYLDQYDYHNPTENVQVVTIKNIEDLRKIYSGVGFYIILLDQFYDENKCVFSLDNHYAIYRGHSYSVIDRLKSHLFNKGWIQMSNATLVFIKLVKNLKQIDLKLSFQKRLLAFDNPVPFWAFR